MMNWAIISTSFAAVIAFWGQLRGFLSRFTSIIFVQVNIDNRLVGPFLTYCWDNYSRSPFGKQRFSSTGMYVKPEKRYQQVAIEAYGEAMTFFNGFRPLFVSGSKNGSNELNGQLTVSFLRGTYDIEKMVIEAIDRCNEQSHGTPKKSGRFAVYKRFGRRIGDRNDRTALNGKSPSDEEEKNFRSLRWKKEDLGLPAPKNPFSDLAFGPEVDDLIKHLKRWWELEDWYQTKGIPHTFGASFYGPPGTGKTSLARAIAQYFGIPVYVLDLNTLVNEELSEAWDDVRRDTPCMVLFEDIDRLFNENREFTTKSGLSLNVLLNCIQGVEPSNGVITIITANDVKRLDPALGVPDSFKPTEAERKQSTRPGRIDRNVYLGPLGIPEKYKIVRRIIDDISDADADKLVLSSGIDTTGAQFTKQCELIALERKWANASD